MICPACGHAAAPGQNFCATCGHPLAFQPAPPAPVKFCRGCHIAVDANRVSCPHCGNLLMLRDTQGAELLRLKDMGIFANPGSALAMRNGTLILRDDQLIFDQPKASAMRKLLDKKTVSETWDESWRMEDIRSLDKGRQYGLRPALVITMKDGNVLRFAGNSLTAELLQQAMQMIEYYIQ